MLVRLEPCSLVRRELFTVVEPFTRGARLGAYVAGATLALSLLGAVAVLTLQPSTETTSYVASDAPAVPDDHPVKARVAVEIDRALLEAAARYDAVGSRPLQLSREPDEAAAPDVPPPAEAAADVAAEAAVAAPAPALVAPPAPTAAAAAPAAVVPPAPTVSPAAPVVVDGDDLRAVIAEYFPNQVELAYNVIMCESSGNASAVSGAGYYGMWQFDLATWQSVGGAGLPSDASVEEQMMRARMLYDVRGWSPWGCA